MNTEIAAQEISKENQDLLVLAVKCKFIDHDKEKKALNFLLNRMCDQPDCQITTIFQEFKLLSKNEVNFLESIKNHLSIKKLDVKFGKLAVANKITTSDVINNALNYQTSHFRKTRTHLPLGDILVKTKKISEAQKTALLLTQDRIEDEFLEKAMNTIAVNELEKLELNKRFGSVAVKKGYVTIEDINQALKIQKQEFQKLKSAKKKGRARFLGEILEEQFGLTPEDTIEILKEQKKYEKRRLSLEKAVLKYNNEIKTNQTLSKLFEYRVSKDKLAAYVRINQEYSDEIYAHSLINWVKLMGINFGFINNEIIDDFLSNGVKGSELEIARGKPAKKGSNASIEFYFDYDSKLCTGEKNVRKRKICKKGDIIARRIPHKNGIPGKNVFGQTIMPPEVDTCDYRCGKGVILQKGNLFVADNDGIPMLYQNQTLFVTQPAQKKEILKISGNIDPANAESYMRNDLQIDGLIEQGATLRCRQLKLDGDVLGCIEAAGDIQIKGTIGTGRINGNQPGVSPLIRTRGNVVVSRRVENAKIECGMAFQSPNADIVDSEICADHGIVAKNVYSNGERASILKLGTGSNSKLAEVQACIDKKAALVEKLTCTPLLKQMEHRLHHQIQVQDEYREKQSALAYLIKIMGNLDLDNIDTLGPGFDFMENCEEISSDGKKLYGIPKKTKAYEYLQEIQEKIENDPPGVQLRKINRISEENYGMYKAAVNATKRMEKEVSAKTGMIKKEIVKNRPEIEKTQKELNDLILEKDYLLLQDSISAVNTVPEIRIKNQISQGTVIVGTKASLVIEKTIYSVKLSEKSDQFSRTPKIVIQGYYE